MIIFINGSINSGKSTIAELLAKEIPHSAVIEIDKLRELISWLPIEEAIPINLENAVQIIKTLAKHSINCIVPYPLSEKNYKYLLDNLIDYKDQISTFTLSPSEEIALSNRGNRVLSDWEKDRIKYHYKINLPYPQFGITIDNGHQNPEQTIDSIITSLRKKA